MANYDMMLALEFGLQLAPTFSSSFSRSHFQPNQWGPIPTLLKSFNFFLLLVFLSMKFDRMTPKSRGAN
jgi:hypothetical protein